MEESSKVCRRCSIEKPASAFARATGNRDGLQRYCRECHKLVREGKAGPPLHKHKPEGGMKRCPHCGETKPLTHEFFPRHAHRKTGLSSWCKLCHLRQTRERDTRDPEAKRASRRASFHRNSHLYREEARLRAQAWYASNLEKRRAYIEVNRDRINEYSRRAHGKRRAQVLATGETFTRADVEAQFERQGRRCHWCGSDLARRPFHTDHVIPLSRGGGNGPDNIVVSCPGCNFRKHNKLPQEWLNQITSK